MGENDSTCRARVLAPGLYKGFWATDQVYGEKFSTIHGEETTF